jgi:hypothetical protein
MPLSGLQNLSQCPPVTGLPSPLLKPAPLGRDVARQGKAASASSRPWPTTGAQAEVSLGRALPEHCAWIRSRDFCDSPA